MLDVTGDTYVYLTYYVCLVRTKRSDSLKSVLFNNMLISYNQLILENLQTTIAFQSRMYASIMSHRQNVTFFAQILTQLKFIALSYSGIFCDVKHMQFYFKICTVHFFIIL